MIADFTVVHAGERIQGQTSPLSTVETEIKFDLGVTTLFLGDSPRMTALYWLMWRSLHPDSPLDSDDEFMVWLADLEAFETTSEDEDEPPAD